MKKEYKVIHYIKMQKRKPIKEILKYCMLIFLISISYYLGLFFKDSFVYLFMIACFTFGYFIREIKGFIITINWKIK